MQTCKTVHDMLLRLEHSEKKNPKLLGYLDKEEWKFLSTEEFIDSVRRASYSFAALGLKKGAKVGVMAFPSPRWTILDVAISSIGLITVPIFPNISEENFHFEVNQTEIKTIFIGGSNALELVQRNRKMFERVIDVDGDLSGPGIMSFEDFLKIGDKLNEEQPDLVMRLRNSIKPRDVATIVYTSGSTGIPKGAVLPHQSIVGTIDVKEFEWSHTEPDLYLNILPLAHIFGRVLNFAVIGNEATVCYLQDPKQVVKACQELRPTVLAVVPRLLEKIYAKIITTIQSSPPFKKTIGQWALDLANDEESSDSIYKHLMHKIADKAVYSAFREAIGGRVRILISGGAALNPHLYHFFEEIGFPIMQGWGLTEVCPVTINMPTANKTATCGRPIFGNQIKIGENNEILVKGPINMLEYYKNPEATSKVIDKDGWIHTGDAGEIDADGYLTIVGRIKELFKTSTGEYIAPVPIEQELSKLPFIDVPLVVAEGRKYATALLFPDFEVLKKMKADQNMSQMSDEEFLQTDYVRNQVKELLESVNANLNRWEKILDYRFVLHHLSIESGELTPSIKVKRDVLEKKFAPIIDSMYVADVAPVI